MNNPVNKLRAMLSVAKDIQKEYAHLTIENIIQQIEARIKYFEKEKKD